MIKPSKLKKGEGNEGERVCPISMDNRSQLLFPLHLLPVEWVRVCTFCTTPTVLKVANLRSIALNPSHPGRLVLTRCSLCLLAVMQFFSALLKDIWRYVHELVWCNTYILSWQTLIVFTERGYFTPV